MTSNPVVSAEAAKVDAFRKEYRARFVGKWYSPGLHVLSIFAIGAVALGLIVSHLKNVTIAEWLVVPVTFLICNIGEWAMHAFVMHKPRKGLMDIYTRHTLNHHHFFSHDRMTFDSKDDYRIVFFPPFALLTLLVLTVPVAAALAWLWSLNAGLLFITTTTSLYLVYETFHYCSHVEDNWFVRNMPFVNTIRRHHAAHHNKGIMMERNMNLTFPIADWLFGTSDLNRGLLGHLFNGYDERYVKPDIDRRAMRAAAGTAGSNS